MHHTLPKEQGYPTAAYESEPCCLSSLSALFTYLGFPYPSRICQWRGDTVVPFYSCSRDRTWQIFGTLMEVCTYLGYGRFLWYLEVVWSFRVDFDVVIDGLYSAPVVYMSSTTREVSARRV